MAQFIPSLDRIDKFQVKPTDGEWALLRFLERALDDSFEVYFNPFLNGDRPDVVIMRQGGGVMIIEVKDWNLELYKLDDKKHWHLKYPQNDREAKAYIKSPIDQAIQYKENLYNLHVEHLLEQNILNSKLWSIVVCGVYFHNASQFQVENLLVTPYQDNRYQKFIKNIVLLGRDSLNDDDFNKILANFYIKSNTPSKLFSEEIYQSIHRLLIPPLHLQNQGRYISRYDARLKKQSPQLLMYSKKQDELIYDKDKRQQWRVKGVVGSGKTTLMAAKAVQAYKELIEHGVSQPQILILTFNITLKNFIHDKIQQVHEEFNWGAFTILNYHQFINSQLNNLGIDFKREDGESLEEFFARYYDNYELFANHADRTERFDVIFIDEIQDYKRVWMDIIKSFFLYDNGEYPRSGYYLLGDVKQNIYNRGIAGKDVVTNVLGVNSLETCFRSDMKIKDLALGFQRSYFNDKYDIDTTLTSEQDFSLFADQNLQQGYLNYIYLQGEDPIVSVFNIIEGNIENKVNNVSINDITVLGVEFEFLKLFDAYYRHKTSRRTSTMFETYEIMFLQGLSEKCNIKAPKSLVSALTKVLRKEYWINDNIVNQYVATLLTIFELYHLYPDTFRTQLDLTCMKYKIGTNDFVNIMNKHSDEYINFKQQVFSADFDFIRNNKKYNFWMNTGNIKISSIHSFKGWESDTIFLILQKKKPGDPSFDELLYTGITRTISNLVVINLGNIEYHENMKKLIDTYK